MKTLTRPLISGLLCAWAVTFSGAALAEAPEAMPNPPTPASPGAAANPPALPVPDETRLSARTDDVIEKWERATKQKPDSAPAWVGLAEAYLQKNRETNDPLYYSRMDAAVSKALKVQPDHYTAIKLKSQLHSARHQFQEAIEWTEKAVKANPGDPINYGILGDIYAELGEYEKVEANYRKMMELLPGRAAYSRASYFYELHGDEPSARAAMHMAIQAGPPKGEAAAWCYVHLGHLNFQSGFLPAAEKSYNAALSSFPGFFHAAMGLGKVKVAQKEYPAAIRMYEKALESGPHHEALGALIEIYSHTGQAEKAKDARRRLGDLQKRYLKYDMDIDFEVAEIDAEQGRGLAEALQLAKEEVKSHGNVKAYDSLAWIAYLNGDMETARSAMEEALHLGTQYPLMYYHAAKIQEKLGNRQESIMLFSRALSKSPYFHLRYAPDARKSVERLTQSLAVESRISSSEK